MTHLGPVASIIIPVYNRHDMVRASIESAINQRTNLTYEIIVVDDGSTDGTIDVIKSFGEKVRLICKENGGAGSSRNAGIKVADSEIIVFLDSDDIAAPDRIETQVSYMLDHPEVGATFGDVWLEGRSKPQKKRNKGFRILDNPFGVLIGTVEGPMLWNVSSAIRKEVYIREGMQDEDLVVGEDFDFWCRASRKTVVAYTEDIFTFVGRFSGDHISRSSIAYRQKTKTLLESYSRFSAEFSEQELIRVYAISRRSINVLLRHEWAYGDRCMARQILREYEYFLPFADILKWRVICSFVPGITGRIARKWLVRLRNRRNI